MAKATVKDGWTRAQVASHLQAAIQVELWTIPYWLTALNSIKPDVWNGNTPTYNPLGTNGNKTALWAQWQAYWHTAYLEGSVPSRTLKYTAYELIMSVAVQEMLHLTLACNLANAMGVPPSTDTPGTGLYPPSFPPRFLMVTLPVRPGEAQLGNVADGIQTMIDVETPDTSGTPVTRPKKHYTSIGDLYTALCHGVVAWWGEMYVPNSNQQSTFEEKYKKTGFTTLITGSSSSALAKAKKVIAAIIDEGEGTKAPWNVVPALYQPNPGGLYYLQDSISHLERFKQVQFMIEHMTAAQQKKWIYSKKTGAAATAEQKQLNTYYWYLMKDIQEGFQPGSGGGVNLRGMGQINQLTAAVWKKGLIPQWPAIGTLPKPLPHNLTPPFELHVCQGLNSCAGHGGSGIAGNYTSSGSMPGDGKCATVFHGCQNTNDCRGQGGCGTGGGNAKIKTDPSKWIANSNQCKGLGGCQSPIHECKGSSKDANTQYFGSGLFTAAEGKDAVTGKTWKSYNCKGTWAIARKRFEARMKKLGKQVGDPGPTTTPIRQGHGTNPKSGSGCG